MYLRKTIRMSLCAFVLASCGIHGTTTSQELQQYISAAARRRERADFYNRHKQSDVQTLKNRYTQELQRLPEHIEQAYEHAQQACSEDRERYARHYKRCVQRLLSDYGAERTTYVSHIVNESTHNDLQQIHHIIRMFVMDQDADINSMLSHNADMNSVLNFISERTWSGVLYLTGYTDMHANQNLGNLPHEARKIRHYLALREHTPSDHIISCANKFWHNANSYWNRFATWTGHPEWQNEYQIHKNILSAYLAGFHTFNTVCRACENRGAPLGWFLKKSVDTSAWTTNNAYPAKEQVRAETAIDMLREHPQKEVMNGLTQLYIIYNFALQQDTDESELSCPATTENIRHRIKQINARQNTLKKRHDMLTNTLAARHERLKQYGTTNKRKASPNRRNIENTCKAYLQEHRKIQSYCTQNMAYYKYNPFALIYGIEQFRKKQEQHLNNEYDEISRSFTCRYNALDKTCPRHESSAQRHARELDHYTALDNSGTTLYNNVISLATKRIEHLPSISHFCLTELDD